eukprot:261479_1
MALLRSIRSSVNNSCRKLSKSNINQLTKQSQCIRSYNNNSSYSLFTKKQAPQRTYKYLSSSYKPIISRQYNQQQFMSPYQFHHPLQSSDQYPVHPVYGVPIHATTIICVRKGDDVVMIGDGQMTIGNVVAKPNARKLRKLNNSKAICGFAGAAADGISLIDLLEKKLSERDELRRACVETSRMWRTDKILRHLNAILIVADEKSTYELTGSGELVESESGIMAIGSGGNFAEAAARALMDRDDLSAYDIATKAMRIAGDMCIYTNHNTLELHIKKGEGIVKDTTIPQESPSDIE